MGKKKKPSILVPLVVLFFLLFQQRVLHFYFARGHTNYVAAFQYVCVYVTEREK